MISPFKGPNRIAPLFLGALLSRLLDRIGLWHESHCFAVVRTGNPFPQRISEIFADFPSGTLARGFRCHRSHDPPERFLIDEQFLGQLLWREDDFCFLRI